jgi:putative ABC transport system permease protein
MITALFQTFNSLGNGVRLPEVYSAENGSSTSITVSGVLQGTKEDKELQLDELKKTFPNLNIKTGKEVVELFVGNMTNQIEDLKNLILILVISINFLITSLILRMLISKEVPEIAILKSLGFHSCAVRRWQLYRIGIILAASILVGTILANTTGNLLTSGVFQIMGITRLHLMIEPMQVYLLYPVIIFTVTMLAVLCSLGQIKRTHVWEINNQE